MQWSVRSDKWHFPVSFIEKNNQQHDLFRKAYTSLYVFKIFFCSATIGGVGAMPPSRPLWLRLRYPVGVTAELVMGCVYCGMIGTR